MDGVVPELKACILNAAVLSLAPCLPWKDGAAGPQQSKCCLFWIFRGHGLISHVTKLSLALTLTLETSNTG